MPAGWRLNFPSRLVQIADVFNAQRTNQPYQPALPVPRIRQITNEEAGACCDVDLLEVFFANVVSRCIADPDDAAASDTDSSSRSTEHKVGQSA